MKHSAQALFSEIFSPTLQGTDVFWHTIVFAVYKTELCIVNLL